MAGGFLLLLLPSVTFAQTSGTTSSNVPVLASGQLPSPVPSDDVELKNVFQGSISAGAFYDSDAVLGNVPSGSGVTHWDLGYEVSPRIMFTETLPRLTWGLTYAPGITISQNLLYRDQFSQNFGGHFTWLATPHSTLSVQQDYTRSNNPFQQFATTPGPIISPNQSIFLPSLLRTSILSNAVYSYQFTAHSSFGLSGSFNSERYNTTPHSGPTTSLIFSQMASGAAYFAHQFSARNQLGFQYGAQVLRFPGANARTTTHTFLIFDDMKLTPNTSLTLYGGPEYSLTSNQVELNLGFVIITIPVKANQWNYAAGAIYSWTGQRLAAVINYSRRISNGGGLVGAVNLNSGTASFRLRLTKRWNLNSSLMGADDQLLAVQSGQQGLLRYSASLGLGRQLSKNVSVNMSFERLNQTGGFAGLAAGNHDLAFASISYSFLKPLGR